MRFPLVLPLLGLLAGVAVIGAEAARSAPGQENLHVRAVMPLVGRDVSLAPGPTRTPDPNPPPPPGEGYCQPSGNSLAPPSPANSVFGLLTIGGEPAPAGTLVTLTFDGLPGPSAWVKEAGGYRVDYNAGGQGHEPPCINQVGTELGLRVNGVAAASSGVLVGDPERGLVFRWDVALP